MLFIYLFIYLCLDAGREGEREGEKHQCVVASHVPPSGDLACNPGTCPDWKSNQQPFGSQVGTQSTEPHQPELFIYFQREGKGGRETSISVASCTPPTGNLARNPCPDWQTGDLLVHRPEPNPLSHTSQDHMF